MRAKAAGEQAIAVADVDHVILATVCVLDAAREALAPDVEVVLGVAAHRRHAGGAGGHVDLLHLGERCGKHPVGVVVAQVLLGDERRLLQVVEALDGVGVKAGLVEALLVERHVLVARDHGLLDALELHLFDLLVGRVENLLHVALL